MWRCSICFCEFDTSKGLMLHFQIIHSLSQDSTYCCGQNNCNRVYTNAKSFRKHLHTHSSETINDSNTLAVASINRVDSDDVSKFYNPENPEKKQPKHDNNLNLQILNSSLEHLTTWLYGHSELNKKTANDILAHIAQYNVRYDASGTAGPSILLEYKF